MMSAGNRLARAVAAMESAAGAHRATVMFKALAAHPDQVDHALAALRRRDKHMGDDFERMINKANVPAIGSGSSSGAWVGNDPSALFLEWTRPGGILGKSNRINRLGFNTAIIGGTTRPQAVFKKTGGSIPISSAELTRTQLPRLSLASIIVMTDQVAKDPDDRAVNMVARDLAKALNTTADAALVDPDNSGISDVMPPSITSSAPEIVNSGALKTDILSTIAAVNTDLENLTLIMTPKMAIHLAAAFDLPDLGANGGVLWGCEVLTSGAVPVELTGDSPPQERQMIVALDQAELLVAEDDDLAVDASSAGTLELDDAPPSNGSVPTESTQVSLFHSNLVALRAVRSVNWQMRRNDRGVAYLSGIDISG